MKAGDNKKRKMEIKEMKEAPALKLKEEILALEMEEKQIMMEEDEDMGALFDGQKD